MSGYDTFILPLLYRMSNLEKLGLYLIPYVDDSFINGKHFKEHIFNRLSRLNSFEFDIHSIMSLRDQTIFPSKEDIQQTFTDFPYGPVTSYVDYFIDKKEGECRISSNRSEMQYYQKVSNHFPGGLYQHVYMVFLYDERPFEHEFFLRISQSFPLMKELHLTNHQSQKSINDNQHKPIIKYNSLIQLDLTRVHDDYLEQFLSDRRTSFHKKICLSINYKSLERVTHNFTRDDTRINCGKMSRIYFYEKEEDSKVLRDYFPSAENI